MASKSKHHGEYPQQIVRGLFYHDGVPGDLDPSMVRENAQDFLRTYSKIHITDPPCDLLARHLAKSITNGEPIAPYEMLLDLALKGDLKIKKSAGKKGSPIEYLEQNLVIETLTACHTAKPWDGSNYRQILDKERDYSKKAAFMETLMDLQALEPSDPAVLRKVTKFQQLYGTEKKFTHHASTLDNDTLKNVLSWIEDETDPSLLLDYPFGPFASGGLGHRGNLNMLAAYSGQYKSTWSVHMAAYQLFQGRNVIFATTEMDHREMLCRIATVCYNIFYSEEPHLQVKVELSGENKGRLAKALKWFTSESSAKRIGCLATFQVGGMTILDLNAKAQEASEDMLEATGRKAQLFVLDYLAQLTGDVKASDTNEALNKLCMMAKTIALGFHGDGILMVTPWQVSRTKHAEVVKPQKSARRGAPEVERPISTPLWYTDADCLSNAHEAERSADRVVGILKQLYDPETVVVSDLKRRRGKPERPSFLKVAPETGMFYDRGKVGAQFDEALEHLAGLSSALERDVDLSQHVAGPETVPVHAPLKRRGGSR